MQLSPAPSWTSHSHGMTGDPLSIRECHTPVCHCFLSIILSTVSSRSWSVAPSSRLLYYLCLVLAQWCSQNVVITTFPPQHCLAYGAALELPLAHREITSPSDSVSSSLPNLPANRRECTFRTMLSATLVADRGGVCHSNRLRAEGGLGCESSETSTARRSLRMDSATAAIAEH